MEYFPVRKREGQLKKNQSQLPEPLRKNRKLEGFPGLRRRFGSGGLSLKVVTFGRAGQKMWVTVASKIGAGKIVIGGNGAVLVGWLRGTIGVRSFMPTVWLWGFGGGIGVHVLICGEGKEDIGMGKYGQE
jgi:hypothetical protein